MSSEDKGEKIPTWVCQPQRQYSVLNLVYWDATLDILPSQGWLGSKGDLDRLLASGCSTYVPGT